MGRIFKRAKEIVLFAAVKLKPAMAVGKKLWKITILEIVP